MTPYRAVLLALFVVGGALTAAVPTGATSVGVDSSHGVAVSDEPLGDAGVTGDAGVAGGVRDARPTAAPNGTRNNSTLGADISSFMQSSAAEVGGAVETGMWTAAFNATDNQSVQTELVERRTSELRTELQALRERKAQLVAEREEGNVSEVAYKAKVSRLLGQINALRSAINATSARATRANASVESLDNLRTQTENLTGPEIASVARNVTGVAVGNGEAGPPNGVGNANNGNGNGAAGTGDRTGPPADAGNGTENGTNASAPGNPPGNSGEAPIVGNGTENGTNASNRGASNGGTPNGSASNGNAPATPPGKGNGNGVGTGNGGDSASQVVASVASAVSETPRFFGHVSDALGARTYAVEYALTVA